MEKCVIYARYSSSNQNEMSIDAQLAACSEHAKRMGYALVDNYIDRAQSATTDDRPAFQQMLTDVKTAAFDVVLVHKFDRFARDTFTHDMAKNTLMLNGARLESVLEPLTDTPESVISESLFKGMAEYYSKNLSREIKKGRMELLKRIQATGIALHISGGVHYGYSVLPSREYAINEPEAKVVRLIFELYVEGKGYKAIVDELDARGYTSRSGRRFDTGAVRDILNYEQYCGTYIAYHNPGNVLYKKNRSLAVKQSKCLKIEHAMPAIISKETYSYVRDRMSRNISAGRQYKAKEPYLLSGLVICGNCGKHMGGQTNSRGIPYYTCHTYTRGNGCNMHRVIRDELETIALDYAEAYFTDDLYDRLIDVLDGKKTEYKTRSKSRRHELEETLASLDKRIDAIINEMLELKSSPALRAKLVELETEKDTLEAELNKDGGGAIIPTLTRGDISKYIDGIAHIKSQTREQQQRLMQGIIRSVKVTDVSPDEIPEGGSKYIYNIGKGRLLKVEIQSIFGYRLSVAEGATSEFPNPSLLK